MSFTTNLTINLPKETQLPIVSILLDNMNESIQLNTNEILYLHRVINDHPEIFQQISANIEAILSDNKIDLHDIPQIILLLSTAYNSIPINQYFMNIDIVNIIQYTIDSILDSGIIILPQIELTIIKQVVDSSIQLLRMTIPGIITETKWCLSFFC